MANANYNFVNWLGLEQLEAKKLQLMADNVEFFDKRKAESVISNIDPNRNTQRNNHKRLGENLVIYGEYREFQPGDDFPEQNKKKKKSDSGKGKDKKHDKKGKNTPDAADKFEKVVDFPRDLFDHRYQPMVFSSLGAASGASSRVSHVIRHVRPDHFSFTVLDDNDDSSFLENSPFFLNYLAIGVRRNADDLGYRLRTPKFKSGEEIKSDDFNDLISSSNYFNVQKLDARLRNIDPLNKQPRTSMYYLKDNLAMYCQYDEFKPGGKKDKSDNKDKNKKKDKGDGGGGQKQKFEKEFVFPSGFFNPLFLPVIIVNIGTKEGQDARFITTISDQNPLRFSISITDADTSGKTGLAENTPMFINYMALGVKGGLSV